VRFLFVSWRDLANPNAGGSEVVVDELARGLRARGHDVDLLCGGPIEAREYPVTRNGGTYSQYLTAPLRYGRRFRDVDLVVDVTNGMPFLSPMWRRGPNLCLLFHVHGEQWGKYYPAPVAAVGKRVEQRALPLVYRNTQFATNSESSAASQRALGLAGSHVSVLDLGATVDTEASAERSPEPLFVAVGRLAPNKRIDLLLDHWADVAPRTGGRLVIVGDGPDAPRIAHRIANDPRLRDVTLEGRVSEARKAELLHKAWLLVHSAEREGWGLVIVEAGTCGTPTLAYDVDGVRDAVEPGVSGELVTNGPEFVECWIALGTDRARCEALGAAATTRARAFSWERTTDQFLAAADAAIALHAKHNRASHDLGPDEVHHPLAVGPERGVRRSVHLFRLFRREQVDPDRFYHYLAADTMRQLRGYMDPAGTTAVDIGGGPGYTAEALRAAGADCMVVDFSMAELGLHDRVPDSAVQGDGQSLPLRSSSAQVVHSSNVLEHVPDWEAMLSEMVRVLEPERGIGYLNFTNWFSPWGGHETSPWHLLGGERAVARYTRKYGRRPKNEFGVSLFRLDIAQVLAWFAKQSDVEVVWVGPRYLPEWMRWIAHTPAVRELITWNLVIVFRRHVTDAATLAASGHPGAAA
jgi:glycosyltransferase involved in cell wall biosynthesis